MSDEKLEDVYGDNDFPIEVDVPFHQTDDNEQDFAYFEILNIEHLNKINRLAAEFYSMYGYKFLPNMDFLGSSHPQEQACFMRACQAHYLVTQK